MRLPRRHHFSRVVSDFWRRTYGILVAFFCTLTRRFVFLFPIFLRAPHLISIFQQWLIKGIIDSEENFYCNCFKGSMYDIGKGVSLTKNKFTKIVRDAFGQQAPWCRVAYTSLLEHNYRYIGIPCVSGMHDVLRLKLLLMDIFITLYR